MIMIILAEIISYDNNIIHKLVEELKLAGQKATVERFSSEKKKSNILPKRQMSGHKIA